MKKDIVIISNSSKGENLFHCWSADSSFYVMTQRGKRGIDNAYSQLSKAFQNLTMSITHSCEKRKITAYFS